MSKELWQESASTLAQLIRSGQSSSREVVAAHLARIERVNGEVNAVVEVRPDEVLADADAADKALKSGEPLGALHGVPFSVKINLDVAGYPTNEGTVALKDLMATSDAPPVERMRARAPWCWPGPTCPTWGCASTPSPRSLERRTIPGDTV